MKLTFRTLVVAVVFAATASAQQSPSSANDQKIIDLERSTVGAFLKGDAKSFQRHLSPTAFGLDAVSGVIRVADWLAAMKDFKVQKWNMENAQVHWLNKETAVITYKYAATGTFMGQPLPPPYWVSSVWINQGGAWKAAFHQESPAPPSPPPAKKK